MCLAADTEDALAYIARQCPKATLIGICSIRTGFSLHSLDSLSKTDIISSPGHMDIPLLLPEHFSLFPEAAILVYCPQHLYVCSRLLRCALSFLGHAAVYPPLAGRPGTVPSPGYYHANQENLEWVFAELADSRSREEFAAMIKAHVTGVMGYIRLAPFESYQFPPAIPRKGDTVIDGGLGSLWPITTFAAQTGATGKCYGFEPNPESFALLSTDMLNLPVKERIAILPLGLFSRKENLSIALTGEGVASSAKQRRKKG
jgi:hypothetical protein